MPVSITGLSESPSAGDKFMVFENEKKAKSIGHAKMMKSLQTPNIDLYIQQIQ